MTAVSPFPRPDSFAASDAAELLARLRLARSRRVGPQTFLRLLAEHGSAAAALDALPGVAAAAGIAAYSPCPEEVARSELRRGRALGARLLVVGAGDYPAVLADLSDPPPVLWAMGDLRHLAHPAVALVGARNASSLGMRMARRLAAELGAAGQVVVSGLARGIDAAAHEGALDTGTVAVFAGGLDVVYPPEHGELAARIAREGLCLSEQPFGLRPQARHFPRRNRIVSGLSRGLVVVEGAARSGSLITARTALDQGREVMAVPGHPMDARAAGCNLLIRDGATLVRSARDVLEVLLPGRAGAAAGPAAPAPQPWRAAARVSAPGPVPAPAAAVARAAAPDGPAGIADAPALGVRILGLLGAAPVAEDTVIRDLGLSAQEVGRELVSLELDGLIERRPGGLVALRP